MLGRFYVDIWEWDKPMRLYGYENVNAIMKTVLPFGVYCIGTGFEPNNTNLKERR